MFQTKEQDKFPETDPNEMELYDFPDRGFIIVVIKSTFMCWPEKSKIVTKVLPREEPAISCGCLI